MVNILVVIGVERKAEKSELIGYDECLPSMTPSVSSVCLGDSPLEYVQMSNPVKREEKEEEMVNIADHNIVIAPFGHHNIVIGRSAGEELTTESYQFIIKISGMKDMRTTMTPEEYEVVNRVARRAIAYALDSTEGERR